MNNEIQAMRAEFGRLAERMAKLEHMSGNGEPIPEADIIELSRRMAVLQADLSRLETRQHAMGQAVRPPDMRRPVMPHAQPVCTPPPTSIPAYREPARKESRFNEKAFGKYFVGVMASVLVLLAVVVLMTSVWDLIPGVMKFTGILAVGAFLAFEGQRRDIKNGFWLSVSGLGCGICFLDIAGGCFFWNVYPLSVAAFLCMVWFMLVFHVAEKLDFSVFYGISYIGGLFAVLTAVKLVEGFFQGILCLVMSACILGVGSMGHYKSQKVAIPVMNFLFGLIVARAMFHQVFFSLYWRELAGNEVSMLRAGFFLTGGMALFESGRMWPIRGRFSKWKPWADTLVSGLCGLWFCGNGLELLEPLPDAAAGFLLSACLAACCFLHRRVWERLFPGVMFVGCMVIMETTPVYVHVFLFPAAALTGFYFLAKHKDIRVQAGLCMLFLFMAVTAGQTYYKAAGVPGHPAVPIVSGCVGAAVFLYAYYKKSQEDSRVGSLEALFCIPGFGIVTGNVFHHVITLADFSNPDVYALYPAVALLLYHRWQVMERRGGIHKSLLHRILWSTGAVVLYLCIHLSVWVIGWLYASDGTAAASVLLLAFACSGLYAAIQSASILRSVMAIAMANHALWFCTVAAHAGLTGLVLSILGLGVSAGFIAIGFWKRRKPLRVAGLCVMIIYVMKISLADIQTNGNVVEIALGLLFGGLVCFGVSFAYNRLDRFYGGNLDGEAGHEE